MSFRRFIYYCALCGGWSAFFGWALGRLIDTGTNVHGRDGLRGMMLGLLVALGLSLVDCLWNTGYRQVGQIIMRVGVAIVVGGIGGLIGGLVGSLLYGFAAVFFVFGWTLTGLLIGVSIATFELLVSTVNGKNQQDAIKKATKTFLGGTIGGVLGGSIALLLGVLWEKIKPDGGDWLLSPTAMGFVALGMCIGLLVGLAQVILKEAWIKVEAGFRSGREMILAKDKTSIGRAEGVDIPLFGDAAVGRLHAHIVREGGHYFLEEAAATEGTFLNERKVSGRMPLSSGDLIRIGKSALRFYEKATRKSA